MGPGTGGFPADIDPISPLFLHLKGMFDRMGRIQATPSIGKRIGGNVQDAHDQGASLPAERFPLGQGKGPSLGFHWDGLARIGDHRVDARGSEGSTFR